MFPEFEVEAVLKSKQLRRREREYLVKWKGYHPIKASWVNESDMEHAQEAIEEFHARPAKKRRRTWWGHHFSFSGAECHIKCITSSCKWNKGFKTSKRLYHENFCISANRVVKWHWTNGTILRKLKSKSDSYLGVEEIWPRKRRQARWACGDMRMP